MTDRIHSTRSSATFAERLITSFDSILGYFADSPLMTRGLSVVHQCLLGLGLPSERLPTRQSFAYTFIASIVFLGMQLYHSRIKRHLRNELETARAKLRYLQEELLEPSETKKEVRIFMDGAFDLLHYGHMNAFRLARSLGTHLVVGVNSDESITECKGSPLMNDYERLTMVSACKFVDEVVPGCPYIMNREYLDYVTEKYKIDYVVHGDDPCLSKDGKDVYEAAKQAGKYRSIPRTEGVSTTDIVGRMLLLTKEHHHPFQIDNESSTQERLGQQSKFLTTSRMLQLFSAGVVAPRKGMRVVYIDGAWDMFHPGHVATLKAARARGDYLIVGIHGDALVNKMRGVNLPLMNLHERVLSVLGCRYVDDVLIDAPYVISKEMIATLNIAEVVRGSTSSSLGSVQDDEERYKHVKEAGIFTVLEARSSFQIERIIERIQRNQEAFRAKFDRKATAEREFYNEKYKIRTEHMNLQ